MSELEPPSPPWGPAPTVPTPPVLPPPLPPPSQRHSTLLQTFGLAAHTIPSEAYTADLAEVFSVGAKNSSARTADQTQTVYFWLDNNSEWGWGVEGWKTRTGGAAWGVLGRAVAVADVTAAERASQRVLACVLP